MKQRKAIVFACLSIVLCVATLIGGTLALFSSTSTVTSHLRAGKLQVTLERVGLTKYVYDDEAGAVAEKVYSEADAYVDFTASTDKNVFDIGASEVVAPGYWYQAKMRLGKAASTVPFDYKVIIKLSGESDAEFAQQLSVSVDGTDKGYLSDYVVGEDGEVVISSGRLDATNTQKEFTVKLRFEPKDTNNSVMDSEVSFDLIVEATQVAG